MWLTGVVLSMKSHDVGVRSCYLSLANQRVEEAKEELLQWSPTVRQHVDTLMMELTKRDALQLVYRAEDHAQALSKEAQTVYRCVSMCVREFERDRFNI